MSTLAAPRPKPESRARPAEVEIVVPVYNEAATLEHSIQRLRRYLDQDFPLSAVVTIVDNASTDATAPLAAALASQLAGVRWRHLDQKGRGRALRAAWSASEAAVVAYMDVDLSTGLEALLPLVAPLVSGHSDLAIGTRLSSGASVIRSPKREVISRCYNLILRGALGRRFSDAQCGFKAMRRDTAAALMPLVADNDWFFDTELLVLAERNGLRIHEVPVDWVDDPDSRVDIARTAWGDLAGIARLLREFWSGEGWAEMPERPGRLATRQAVGRLAGVGVVSTLGFLVLFVLLHPLAGAWIADLVALGMATVANAVVRHRMEAHQPLRADPRRHVLQALAVLATNAVLTLAALALVQPVHPSLTLACLAVTAGTLAAGFLRVLALQAWWSKQAAATAASPGQCRPAGDGR